MNEWIGFNFPCANTWCVSVHKSVLISHLQNGDNNQACPQPPLWEREQSQQSPPASLIQGPWSRLTSLPAICKKQIRSYMRIWGVWHFQLTGHPEIFVGHEELGVFTPIFFWLNSAIYWKGSSQESYCLLFAWILNLCWKTACLNWKYSITLSLSPTHIPFLDSDGAIAVNNVEWGPQGLRNM